MRSAVMVLMGSPFDRAMCNSLVAYYARPGRNATRKLHNCAVAQRASFAPTMWPTAIYAWASDDSVEKAQAPAFELLDLPQLEPTTTFRRLEERLSRTADQRIDLEPELVHEPGVDETRRRPSAPDQVDILAGLLLEGGDFVEASKEARIRPESRSHGAR